MAVTVIVVFLVGNKCLLLSFAAHFHVPTFFLLQFFFVFITTTISLQLTVTAVAFHRFRMSHWWIFKNDLIQIVLFPRDAVNLSWPNRNCPFFVFPKALVNRSAQISINPTDILVTTTNMSCASEQSFVVTRTMPLWVRSPVVNPLYTETVDDFRGVIL